MGEKLEAMTAGGVDTATPRALVVSIRKGGWLQSQQVQRAITALTSDFNDSDLGCLVCDFGVWYAKVKKKLHNDLAIHALLHRLLTSEGGAAIFLRTNGVNAGLLAFFLRPETDPMPFHPHPLLHLRSYSR